MTRKQCATNFYTGASDKAIRELVRGFEPPELSAPPAAGLVPHAGWVYSGAIAAKVFQTIKSCREPEAFVLFGTVHRRVPSNSVYARGSWSTPMGDVAVDEGLANRLIEHSDGLLDGNESAHNGEHSIEVQMPFLKHFFPEAKAVPISVLPNADAAPMGNLVGEYIRDNNIDAVVIGTTDLTHYGEAYGFTPAGQGTQAHEWMKKNDAGIIDLAREMRSGEIVPEARESMNACGAGAMAATVAAAAALGCASGLTIDYTTSYDVVSEREFRMAVGYVGMIFCPS